MITGRDAWIGQWETRNGDKRRRQRRQRLLWFDAKDDAMCLVVTVSKFKSTETKKRRSCHPTYGETWTQMGGGAR
ncbi:hypothetical protein CSPX01_12745 [Colletotrichum filicis]|nr:hypothetical protein CSPX01_12745 [Colletotrichum filicis]